ncbi:helix-turn-helix transcriptional regulator [Mailhella sp.]
MNEFASQNVPNPAPQPDSEGQRITRLLRMAQEIRREPRQTQEALYQKLGVGRSQYYKDKAALAEVGFRFDFHKSRGFRILEDRPTPITGLTLSDRLLLMFALEHLSAEGDGTLAALAMETGRKLASGLDSPFREQIQQSFDSRVTAETYGVKPDVLAALQDAVREGRRVRVLYTRSADWTQSWREIDPRRLYIRHRAVYLYARTADETPPEWKIFRLNRVAEVRPTGICFDWDPAQDDGFEEKQRNAFSGVFGDRLYLVRLRFTGSAMHYVMEKTWHHSQQIQRSAHELLFSVRVTDPQEVLYWARQWGREAEVLGVEPEEG